MKNLYFIRHGRQNCKLCNVNVELAPEGQKQAELLGRRMLTYSIDALYSSHLLRALETAEILNKFFHVPHNIRTDIEEINFGQLTGHTDEYINQNFRDFQIERNKMISDIAFPGGECGNDVMVRAMPVIREIIESGYERVAIVTHGGVIRTLTAALLGLGQERKLLFARDLENCSITHFQYNEINEMFYLERLNDAAHLESEPMLMRSRWKKGI